VAGKITEGVIRMRRFTNTITQTLCVQMIEPE